MSWDGQSIWYVNANGGSLHQTSMDGLNTQTFDGWTANHDIAPLPEGSVATFTIIDAVQMLVEVDDEGNVTPIIALGDLYDANGAEHPNAITYLPRDDAFIISDLSLDGFVKGKRTGELVWQLGGSAPKANSFSLQGIEPWRGNHGHDLTPDGKFLFFTNFYSDAQSRGVELLLACAKV